MLHQFRRRWHHYSTSSVTIPTVSASTISTTTSTEQQLEYRDDDHGESSHNYRTLPTNVTTTPTTASDKTLAKKIAAILVGQSIPWPKAVEVTLTQLYPSITRAVVFLSLDIVKPPSTALHFFNFLRHRFHFPLDDRIHFKLLQVLCRCRDLSPAREFLFSLHTDPADDTLLVLHDRFFNELIRAHARRRQLQRSIDLFRIMKDEFRVPPSVFSYNSLLAALFNRGRTVYAKKLFDEMTEKPTKGKSYQVRPDVCTFNTMIRGFCLNGLLEEGFRWFGEMAKWQCEPDVCTYNTLLDGLCRAGKVDVGRNFFNGMKNKSVGVRPNVVSYTTLIRGYCQKRRVSDALEVFREMAANNVEQNTMTYNTIIHGLCESGEFEQTREIMEFGSNSGFKPDIITLNTLITAYCNKSNITDAIKTFHTMPELKLKADLATYSVLICKLCETRDFEMAETFLDDMMNKRAFDCKKGSASPMAAYNPILTYLCHNGKSKKAGDVFKFILKKSTTLDPTSFKILILGHCKESDFHQGYMILLEMLSRELVPEEETFKALIDGFFKDKNTEFAWKTFKKMLNNRYRPKTANFHAMLRLLVTNSRCGEEASELMLVMLERRIMLDIELSTLTVIGLYRKGLHDKGFEIVEMLYEKGYRLKMEELVKSLCGDRKFLEAYDLLLLGIEKNENLPGDVYAMDIRGLCGIRRAMDAFRLFYELNEKKAGSFVFNVEEEDCCLGELEVCLERDGNLKEAEFVCKRRENA